MWKGEYQGTKVAVNVLRVDSSDFNEVGSVSHRAKPSSSVKGVANYDCVEILQASHYVEKSPPSKRAPIVGSDDVQQALLNDIRMDG